MENLSINGSTKMKMFFLLAFFSLCLTINVGYAQYGAWTYRSPVRIIENSGIAKTNYQVRLVVNTAAMVSAGHLDATGKDLRFGDCTNPNQYNFWIESGMNTTSTEIWVLLPSLAANDTATVFMYYGNNAAVTESNFDSTFTVATRLIVTTGTVPLAGVNNYSWFEVQAGATVQNAAEDFLEINARKIKISGTLDGLGQGEIPAPLGFEWTAPGSGKYGCGGGGGAHGGNGGIGSTDAGCPYGVAGISQGSPNINSTLYGYSGGDSDGALGGAGGGAVTLNANDIDITGIINMSGTPGAATNPLFGGSGGGAGGGILIRANEVSVSASGQLLANGGKGGDKPTFYGGGGGGGGRVKIFYDNVYTNAGTISVQGGIAGQYGGGHPAPGAGQVGSVYSDAFYNAGEPTVIISSNSSFNLTSSDLDNSICIGTSVTFTATSGYTNYKFLKNSGTVLQNGASNSYVTTALADNDTIYAITNFDGCPDTSNLIIMNVDNYPTASSSNTGAYCAGQTIQLNSSGGGTYAWAGPGGYTNSTQNPTIPLSTVAMSGVYSVTVSSAAGCTSTSTTTVVVNANPIANATNTGPYCEGATIQLSSVGGFATDDWTGPNAYAQNDMQNPTIASATIPMSGSYTVLVTNAAGCTSTATTNVVVNANPIANATNTGPYCEGSTIQLNSVGGAATDDWTGPNAYAQNNIQNPTIVNSTAAMSGLYTVTATNASGCTATATTNVVVNALPSSTAGSNAPLCNGQTLNLTSSGGIDYDWTGPGGYVQNDMQNPSIVGVTAANAGIYTVTVTGANGCSNTATVSVVISSSLIITASSNSPVCLGSNIDLSVTTVVGGVYGWTGPNSFTSTMQNPTILSSTMAMAGTYTVGVTNGGGCSGTATVNVVVNSLPIPTATSNSPVCEGGTLDLMSEGGVDFDWTGPNAYVQNDVQNPSISPVTLAGTGTYVVTVTGANGCSATASTSVTINANPITPTISQSGDTLIANPSSGYTYQWYMNGNPIIGATSYNYVASQTDNYSVVITNANGCSSSSVNYSYTSTVSINENQWDAGINIYPNPTVGYVNISFTEPASGRIELIDLNGRIIQNKLIPDGQTLVSLDLSTISSGIYQLRITTTMYTGCKKLVIK